MVAVELTDWMEEVVVDLERRGCKKGSSGLRDESCMAAGSHLAWTVRSGG
jgi:hypothetical protein